MASSRTINIQVKKSAVIALRATIARLPANVAQLLSGLSTALKIAQQSYDEMALGYDAMMLLALALSRTLL